MDWALLQALRGTQAVLRGEVYCAYVDIVTILYYYYMKVVYAHLCTCVLKSLTCCNISLWVFILIGRMAVFLSPSCTHTYTLLSLSSYSSSSLSLKSILFFNLSLTVALLSNNSNLYTCNGLSTLTKQARTMSYVKTDTHSVNIPIQNCLHGRHSCHMRFHEMAKTSVKDIV